MVHEAIVKFRQFQIKKLIFEIAMFNIHPSLYFSIEIDILCKLFKSNGCEIKKILDELDKSGWILFKINSSDGIERAYIYITNYDEFPETEAKFNSQNANFISDKLQQIP